MSWQFLPVEIQTIIFQHLKQSQVQLNQCQLTCRGWFATAQKELYTNVYLKRSKLDVFAQSVSNEPASHGNYVNTIHFYELGKKLAMGHETASLLKVAKYCPNTKRAVMMSPYGTLLFRNAFNQIGIAGLWNLIKELPQKHLDMGHYSSYIKFQPLFTKSLENIHFSLYEDIIRNSQATANNLIAQKLNSIADYLQKFQHIKKVSFHLIEPVINLQFMDEFFDKVPATVNSIEFGSSIDADHSLENDQNIDSMVPIKKNDHLKSFQTTLPILNANTIEYALTKFPRLSSLILIRAYREYTGSALLFDMSETLLNQIMELDTFGLYNLTLRDHTVVFDTLIKEGDTVKELTLTRYPRYSISEFYLDIKKYWKNGANVVSISAKSNQSNRGGLPQNIEMFREMELLEKYGASLKKLTICNLVYHRNWNCPCSMVNSLIQKCPHLKTLVFAGPDINNMNEVIKSRGELPSIQNLSVETLVVNQQFIPTAISNHLSRQFPSLSKVVMIIETNGPGFMLSVRNGLEFDRYLNRKKATWIDMPHSRLDSVHLKYEVELEVHQNRLLFIRLDVNDRVRYFYCLQRFTPRVKTLFNECTEKVLGDCLSKTWYRKVAYCSIKCMSLKQLAIESNSYQRSYYF